MKQRSCGSVPPPATARRKQRRASLKRPPLKWAIPSRIVSIPLLRPRGGSGHPDRLTVLLAAEPSAQAEARLEDLLAFLEPGLLLDMIDDVPRDRVEIRAHAGAVAQRGFDQGSVEKRPEPSRWFALPVDQEILVQVLK